MANQYAEIISDLKKTEARQSQTLADTEAKMAQIDKLPPTDTTNTLRHKIALRIKNQQTTLERTRNQLREVEAAAAATASQDASSSRTKQR